MNLATRITHWMIARRWLLLVLGLVLALFSWVSTGKLKFDRSVENMFAEDDPLLPPYRQMKRTFGGNEIVLVAYVDPDLMTPGGMRRLAALSDRIERVPGVASVLTMRSALGDAIISPRSDLAPQFRELFEGHTHGTDGQTTAIVCMLTPKADTVKTVQQLRDEVETPPYLGTVAGEPVMVVDGFRYIEEDGQRLGVTSTVLLGLTIVLCFRSLRWVVVPIAVVQLTLLLTQAILWWGGFHLSMVSSMLTAIVTVVGVATVLHLIVRFRDARAEGLAPQEALTRAGKLLAAPIFWACATDAVGFGALWTASVGPVQDFGMMMAVGSLLVIVGVVLVVPGLALLGPAISDPKRAWGEDWLDGGLRRLLGWVEQRPKTVGAVVFVLAGTAAVGGFRLEVETDFTRNFRENSPIVQSYEFIEERLGGAGVWDVVLPAPPPEQLSWAYLRRVLRLEARLRTEVPELTKVLSVADAVMAGSLVDPSGIPLKRFRDVWVRTGIKKMSERMPDFTRALIAEDPDAPGKHYLRIMLRARERQPSAQKRAMIEAVERISREEFEKIRGALPRMFDDADEVQVTGFFVLLTNLIDSIVRDQWMTFGYASAGIGLMMLVAFRSLRLALVALVPNALPIVMVTGVMGWLGLKINMGAAMIAAVSMGLAVDSSIHYITAFRRERNDGRSVDEALDRVQQSVGRAMVFSTLALVVGFSSLCQSQFVPTIYFGALVSLSMLGGLAGNLVLLPLLLRIVMRDRAAA